MSSVWYLFFADCVLIVHFSLVLFVVGGLIIILAGNIRNWSWVNGWWFRLLHLAAIVLVAAESWVGIACPLTTLESWLRHQGGAETYGESFIEHWVQAILFYRAPAWVFTMTYTLFAVAVIATLWHFPPRRKPRGNSPPGPSCTRRGH